MADSSRTTYGSGAVYGSLAYDFDNPALFPEIDYSSPLERPAAPRTREKSRVAAQTAARRQGKQSVAPMAVIGILVAAALFVVAIIAQVQLLDISARSVELQSQLQELETEQAKLQIAYEGAFNFAEVERYAIYELGMQKPTADQVYYIDTSAPDRAVVVQRSGGDGFVDRVSDFLLGIGSYFQ